MSPCLPSHADVAIVGGGIAGLAAAYECARRGMSVVLLERERIGRAQSGRNLGFVRQQGRAEVELPLMAAALRRWQSLTDELGSDVEFFQGGNLRLTDDPAKAELYERWAAMARARGLDTRTLPRSEVRAMLPGADGFEIALFTASDGQANPEATCRAYADAGRRAGVVTIEGCPVQAIATAGGAVAGVETALGTIDAPVVLLAAGTGSRRLARTIGREIPQQMTRMTVALTQPAPPSLSIAAWTGRIFLRQDRRGCFVLAAEGRSEVALGRGMVRDARRFLPTLRANRSALQVRVGPRALLGALSRAGARATGDDVAPGPIADDVAYSLARVREYLPAAGDVQLQRAWAGEIDATPDALPVLDGATSIDGLVIATGLSGHGFGLGPAIGAVVANLVAGQDTGLDLHPFRLARFSDGTPLEPAHLL